MITGDAINRGQIFSDDFPALLATQFVWGSVLGGDSFNEYWSALFFANASNNALRVYTASLAAHRLSWGRMQAMICPLQVELVPPTLTIVCVAVGRLPDTWPADAHTTVAELFAACKSLTTACS